MKTSTNRILTTHVGSIPRPEGIRALLRARVSGQSIDEAQLASRVAEAVAEVVRTQAEAASAGVGCVGPMAPQDAVSQTTQQEPWIVWLTETSVLPQNGHGSSALITYTCAVYPSGRVRRPGPPVPSRTS